MQWFYRIKHLKIALVIAALLIAVCSLVVSHFLIRDLEQEEYKRMEDLAVDHFRKELANIDDLLEE